MQRTRKVKITQTYDLTFVDHPGQDEELSDAEVQSLFADLCYPIPDGFDAQNVKTTIEIVATETGDAPQE